MIITVTPNPAVNKIYWVDKLKVGSKTQDEFLTRATRSSTSAGGKGVNISIFLAGMGIENVAMGFISGHAGHVLINDLRDKGVTTNFCWTSGETRTNVIIMEQGKEHIPIEVDEGGSGVTTIEVERFIRRYKRALSRASWVVLGGVLPPGVDDGFYHRLIKLAKEKGINVVVSATGTPLTRALSAAPYLVKPDLRESLIWDEMVLDTEEHIIAAGKKVIAMGVDMMLISHEVTGDILVTAKGVWEVKARVEMSQLQHLVGADDVFLGGMIYKLQADEGVEGALKFGMAAGTLYAEHGASVCRAQEKIEQEMSIITLEQLEGPQ